MRTLLHRAVLCILVSLTLLLTSGVGRPASTSAAAELLLNGDFEAGNTNEWAVSSGSIAVTAPAHAGAYAVAITGTATVTQSLDSAAVVNRSLTVSGWIYSDGDRGVNLQIDIAVPTGTNTSICNLSVTASPSTWSSFSTTCTAPAMIYPVGVTPRLKLAMTGSSGSVRLDDLSISATGSAPSFSINKQNVTLGTVPPSAEIIVFIGGAYGELQVMNGDNSNVTHITFNGQKNFHSAMSPSRTMIAVNRYVDCSFDDAGKCTATEDPQAVWIIDLEHRQEWQLLPGWINTGMGGLDWSPDGQWVYFGITNGRYASAYRVHPDGTALTFIGPPNMDWASDVAVSDDGQWIVYKHAARSSSGSYLGRGGIWAMRIDGSENHQISIGQAGSCGPGWPVDDYDPEWSPDRQQVVFSALNATTCGWDIVRINADGTNRTTVFASTSSSTWNFIPDWNDNGILFTEMVLMVPQYYGGTIIQPDGSGKTRVGGNGGYVRWIPSTLAPSTPTPIAPVGGIAELSSGSGSEESTDAWVLGVTLGAALALGLGAWHVRRRWLHRKA